MLLFSNISNEIKVVKLKRLYKKTLNIAIFTFTLDSIYKAIKEIYQRELYFV